MGIEELIARLHNLKPRPIVIVMSREAEYTRMLLKDGVDAFVSKGDEPHWLVEKLHQYAKQVKMREAANRDEEIELHIISGAVSNKINGTDFSYETTNSIGIKKSY
jgi:DNA-binding NarL/FixJ family response regulator